jgi:Phage tail tube protein, GTA-gp10
MSRHGDITRDFADGTYVFRLALGQWRELQEKLNAGPQELYERLILRRWKVDDPREIIRLGLIGGGQVKPVDALKLVDRYCFPERPMLETLPLAIEIVAESIKIPDDDDEAQKKSAAPAQENESSISAPFTETVQ